MVVCSLRYEPIVGHISSNALVDGGDLLDQALVGRIVPTINGVGVVGHAGILPDWNWGRAES